MTLATLLPGACAAVSSPVESPDLLLNQLRGLKFPLERSDVRRLCERFSCSEDSEQVLTGEFTAIDLKDDCEAILWKRDAHYPLISMACRVQTAAEAGDLLADWLMILGFEVLEIGPESWNSRFRAQLDLEDGDIQLDYAITHTGEIFGASLILRAGPPRVNVQ
jgi:hypothetical protein